MSEISDLLPNLHNYRRAGNDPTFLKLRADLQESFLKARKRKLRTSDEVAFEECLSENLDRLAKDIYYHLYQPTAGIAFIQMSGNGVVREIYAAPFRDRIVHHYIYSKVAPWWDRRQSYYASSCREGKGTKHAILSLKKQIRAVSQNYTKEVIVWKMDISGFFMSLKRELLLEKAMWGLNRQFSEVKTPEYFILAELIEKVLMQDPTETVRYRGRKSDWNLLPKNKILSEQPAGYGIVIGNLTSQLFSNVFMDGFDRLMEHELGLARRYGRYVDDGYAVLLRSEKKEFLRKMPIIKNYLEGVLGLKLHPRKTKFYEDIYKGIPFLGMVLYPHHIVPNRRFKLNMHLAVAGFAEGRKGVESLRAYEGILKPYNGRKLVRDLYQEFGFDIGYSLIEIEKAEMERKMEKLMRGVRKARGVMAIEDELREIEREFEGIF